MAFAQLTHRESLRDLESCLRAVSGKLYHLGDPGTGYETPKLQFRIADSGTLINTVEIVEGVLAVEGVELLRGFFEERR